VIRVVVADDQDLVRTGLRMILDGEPDMTVVGEAENGRRAIELAVTARPDVILMDVRMPLTDGIEATRAILAGGVAAPRVLMLTTFDLDEHVYAALTAGASGFLLKDTPATQILDAIRVVHGGDALLSPAITRRLITRFVASRGAASETLGAVATLTIREREVLVLMARGLSNAEIAGSFVISEATVKTHVSRVLAKLAVRDRAQAVIAAYEAGVVVPGT